MNQPTIPIKKLVMDANVKPHLIACFAFTYENQKCCFQVSGEFLVSSVGYSVRLLDNLCRKPQGHWFDPNTRR